MTDVQDLVRRLDQCRRLPRGEQVVFEREFIDQLHAALEALSASRAAPTDEEIETAARAGHCGGGQYWKARG